MRIKTVLKRILDIFVVLCCFALVALMILQSMRYYERQSLLSAAVEGAVEMPEYSGTISFPVLSDINVSLAGKSNDFSYKNPETNDCYIRVSITRLDNNEIVYQSSSISPGNAITGICFSPEFKYPGIYDVRIKIDAHARDKMKYLNGIVVNKKIIVS